MRSIRANTIDRQHYCRIQISLDSLVSSSTKTSGRAVDSCVPWAVSIVPMSAILFSHLWSIQTAILAAQVALVDMSSVLNHTEEYSDM